MKKPLYFEGGGEQTCVSVWVNVWFIHWSVFILGELYLWDIAASSLSSNYLLLTRGFGQMCRDFCRGQNQESWQNKVNLNFNLRWKVLRFTWCKRKYFRLQLKKLQSEKEFWVSYMALRGPFWWLITLFIFTFSLIKTHLLRLCWNFTLRVEVGQHAAAAPPLLLSFRPG